MRCLFRNMVDFSVRKLTKLREVLLDPQVSEPADVYFVIRDRDLLHGLEPNITIIPPHKLGGEFPKTYGHYHQHSEPETYRILYGRALLFIQKPKKGETGSLVFDEIEEACLLSGGSGDVLRVPQGFGHCLINPSPDLLVTADWESETAVHLYQPIKNLRGFCYYVIEGDGRIKYVRNPNYQRVPKLKSSSDGL